MALSAERLRGLGLVEEDHRKLSGDNSINRSPVYTCAAYGEPLLSYLLTRLSLMCTLIVPNTKWPMLQSTDLVMQLTPTESRNKWPPWRRAPRLLLLARTLGAPRSLVCAGNDAFVRSMYKYYRMQQTILFAYATAVSVVWSSCGGQLRVMLRLSVAVEPCNMLPGCCLGVTSSRGSVPRA